MYKYCEYCQVLRKMHMALHSLNIFVVCIVLYCHNKSICKKQEGGKNGNVCSVGYEKPKKKIAEDYTESATIATFFQYFS